MIDPPMVRPGGVRAAHPSPRVVAYFRNSSLGNLAIQRLVGLGIPSDGLAVVPPDRLDGGQGMILSIPCPGPAPIDRVEALCRTLGAEVHRQSS